MRILLVDDHSLFREGIRLLLTDLLDDAQFEQADSCEAALAIAPNDIDLVLLDFHLPGMSDQDACRKIRDHFSASTIVVLSGEDDPTTIRKVITDGAAGFIPKSSSPDVMLAALNLVLAGGTYLPPHVLDDVGGKNAEEPATDEVLSSIEHLSDRQMMVLARAIQGKLNKVIASELNIAEGTVKAHLSAAYKALGAHNRTEAVYIATKHKLPLMDFL